MSTEQNKEFVRNFLQLISSGDAAAIADCYAPNGRVWTAGTTLISGSRSVEQIREFAGGVLSAFPNGLKYTIHNMVAEGDFVAVECEAEGEHVSGQAYAQQYHFLFKIRNGKLLELKEYMDTELVTEVLCGGQRPGLAES